MTAALRARIRAFLEGEPPAGLGYVPDSIAERILRLAAAGEPLDDEMEELLDLCVLETRDAAERRTGAVRDYLEGSAALLEAIAAERG